MLNTLRLVKYKNSIDTVSIEEGTLELQDKGKIINRNVNSTTIYFEQNIKELTSNVLRYSFTIREKNYDFSFRKQ